MVKIRSKYVEICWHISKYVEITTSEKRYEEILTWQLDNLTTDYGLKISQVLISSCSVSATFWCCEPHSGCLTSEGDQGLRLELKVAVMTLTSEHRPRWFDYSCNLYVACKFVVWTDTIIHMYIYIYIIVICICLYIYIYIYAYIAYIVYIYTLFHVFIHWHAVNLFL